jgi:hypothetical protein
MRKIRKDLKKLGLCIWWGLSLFLYLMSLRFSNDTKQFLKTWHANAKSIFHVMEKIFIETFPYWWTSGSFLIFQFIRFPLEIKLQWTSASMSISPLWNRFQKVKWTSKEMNVYGLQNIKEASTRNYNVISQCFIR